MFNTCEKCKIGRAALRQWPLLGASSEYLCSECSLYKKRLKKSLIAELTEEFVLMKSQNWKKVVEFILVSLSILGLAQ